MKKWRCTVCGEIIESDVRPDLCPRCKATGDKFVEVKDDEGMTWAAEHVVGIAKDCPQEIIDGLRANFEGECSVSRYVESRTQRGLSRDRSVLGEGST